MCLIFTCGEHTFRKEVEGYEGLTCQCHNCGNYSAHVIKSNPWFTFCFVVSTTLSLSLPLLPMHHGALPWTSMRRTKRSIRAQIRAGQPASHHTSANQPLRRTARPASLLQRLPRCPMPRLQLRPTAREQTRRYEHEGRRQ
ncbi:hypothetical protein F4808DRAFT_70368 [Astrocystis sublimbata]|nr:hypothetical protein F4808DRAFT_70368 [Astrocystis sublimbata]